MGFQFTVIDTDKVKHVYHGFAPVNSLDREAIHYILQVRIDGETEDYALESPTCQNLMSLANYLARHESGVVELVGLFSRTTLGKSP